MIEATGRPADQAFDADVLMPWRRRGSALVTEHRAEFNRLLERVDALVASGRDTQAAAAAQVAANYATFWHAGLFASASLERALQAIGERAAPCEGRAPQTADPRRAMKVLHVATQVAVVAGHARMMARWIDHDAANSHSLALTRQAGEVPGSLSQAVTASGGRVAHLNRAVGGLLVWARRLQGMIAEADLVVLHVHNMDVIPFIALAGMRRRPPVIFLNHSDHLFWLGAGFSDLVVNTRVSGFRLSETRRGIDERRNALLPLCLEPVAPRGSRDLARKSLGLPSDSIVILTIARSVKFRPVGGQSYADALLPILRHDPRVWLVAVGPGRTVGWGADDPDIARRIMTFDERPDTAQFLDAADIYLDSFPFSSITSMFEAGLHGLPLITRNPFGPGCEIMGADSPGLDDGLIRTQSTAGLQTGIARLISDPAARAAIGERTRQDILATNTGAAWTEALHEVYARAMRCPRATPATMPEDTAATDDVDCFSPFVYGNIQTDPSAARKLAIARETALKVLPPGLRLRTWAALALQGGFAFRSSVDAWKYLVPEWVSSRARGTVRIRRSH
ncbi:hypothetical protein RNZ50_10895 [Paracoccaceae bacterium Fryx2]|nr:hypothetical protein [Paracoccaceae bacterium Fryx2]